MILYIVSGILLGICTGWILERLLRKYKKWSDFFIETMAGLGLGLSLMLLKFTLQIKHINPYTNVIIATISYLSLHYFLFRSFKKDHNYPNASLLQFYKHIKNHSTTEISEIKTKNPSIFEIIFLFFWDFLFFTLTAVGTGSFTSIKESLEVLVLKNEDLHGELIVSAILLILILVVLGVDKIKNKKQ